MTTTAQDPATFPACIASAAEVHYEFRAGCPGCAARALSSGPQFMASKRCGSLTAEYRAALLAVGVSHADVLDAAKTDMVRG